MFPQIEATDLGALWFFQYIHRPWLDTTMLEISRLGDLVALMTVSGVSLWLMLLSAAWATRQPRLQIPLDAVGQLAIAEASLARVKDRLRMALILLSVILLGWLTNDTVKMFVARPRPDVAFALLDRSSSASFPSGHALLGLTVYGTLAMLVGRRLRNTLLRGLLALFTTVLVMALGASRLYLGVHFVSDVLGGWLAGGALVLLAYWADRPGRAPARTGLQVHSHPAAIKPVSAVEYRTA